MGFKERKMADQQFVEEIVKAIVTKPEEVQVKRTVDEMGVLIELTVAKEDMAVIIGKEGKTVNALRTLLRVLGAKNDARLNLKIIEPEGSERPQREESPRTEQAREEAPRTEQAREEAPRTEQAKEEAQEEEEPIADLEL